MDNGVPAVQSLVQSGATRVPSRFVRPLDDRPDYTCGGLDDQLPIIDASRLNEESELEKLFHACSVWGFFQLTGHGIPSSLLHRTRDAITGFFDLPQAEKELYAKVEENKHVEGYGRYFLPSEQTVLDWADVFFHFLPPRAIAWPVSPPEYRDTIEEYSGKIQNLAMRLLSALSVALKQEPGFFTSAFGAEPHASLRMNYYPPCPQPDLVLGLSPHSDGAGVTILLQNEVPGLQIRRKGEWKAVESIPDAFVVNVGDILEIMSNGAYKSVEHRAVVSSSGKARISAALFYSPSFETVLRPLIGEEEDAKFKEMQLVEFLRFYMSKELKGKDHLEFAKL